MKIKRKGPTDEESDHNDANELVCSDEYKPFWITFSTLANGQTRQIVVGTRNSDGTDRELISRTDNITYIDVKYLGFGAKNGDRISWWKFHDICNGSGKCMKELLLKELL